MYHITSHSEIDRALSVGEIIDDNIALTIAHQKHYAFPEGNYPDDGQLVIAADKEQWRPFSLDEVEELPVFGELLREAIDFGGWPSPGILWKPATFIVKVVAGQTTALVDMSHLRLADTIHPKHVDVSEIGLGQIGVDSRRRIRSLASVTLCKALSQGEETITARSYGRVSDLGFDSVLNSVTPPDEDVCKDFLQMQRNAMWNTTSEPI
jgi:hypothetical protein